MRANLIPLAALLAAACATTQGPVTAAAGRSRGRQCQPEPGRCASGFPRPESCEEEARRLTGNERAETGIEAVAKMSEVDPFFEPGRQFVVLARLDGVRSEPSEDPDESRKVALVSIVAYFEPSHAVIE